MKALAGQDRESPKNCLTGSRIAVDVTRDAIQVHGGYGFVRQLTADAKTNHLESIWRDSKVGEI